MKVLKLIFFFRFVVIDLGLSIVPVETLSEAAILIFQMVTCEQKIKSNPFMVKPKLSNTPDLNIFTLTTLIPGLGEKKAIIILEKYNSLQGISNASLEDLKCLLGTTAGSSVHSFFNKTNY